jgi:cellobiose phosphorylase
MTSDATDLRTRVHLRSAADLTVLVNANGSIGRMDLGAIALTLFRGTEIEGGPTNVYLRRHGTSIESTPLLGPQSPATIHLDERGLHVRGEWNAIRFDVSLVLADAVAAWFWHVSLENAGSTAQTVDLVYAQDLALAHYGAVRMNEYYVSQYVDYTPLVHAERGTVLAVRQNLPMDGRHPWAMVGSLGRGASVATDALDLHGLATRAGSQPAGLMTAALPGRRQHEHSMAVVQDDPVQLSPGSSVRRGFFGAIEEHHPEPSSDADLVFVDRILALTEAGAPGLDPAGESGAPPAPTLFSACPFLEIVDLNDVELASLFGSERRAIESEDGTVLSFFAGAHRHVVLRAKELAVLRPHGHVMRTGDGLAPDEASLTTTAWMNGVFHSLVTQGHVNINRVFSTVRSYLGLVRAGGQRIFVEMADGYRLLGVPSAFEMTPGGCRWIYKHAGGLIEIRSRATTDRHELGLSLAVLAGEPRRFVISSHVALGGDDGAETGPTPLVRVGEAIVMRTVPDTDVGRRFPLGWFRIDPLPGTVLERVGGDECLFADGRSRDQPYVVMVTAPAREASFRIMGGLIPMAAAEPTPEASEDAAKEDAFWREMAGGVTLHPPRDSALAAGVAGLQEILPWLAHDAMIHYLAPRGLEQFSGGGWGTRDVSQGPVEMLLALGRWEALRDLLLRIFGAQNPDGDWPQWFTFFERDRDIRAADSHGDIVFWPVLALAQYVSASDDATILAEDVPFFHPEGHDCAERATIVAHVARAFEVVERRTIPGTSLVAYGNGDWNDSLQPVDPSMRERLCSTWTVTLHAQTLATLAQAFRRLGRPGSAARFEAQAARTRAEFRRRLLADDTLAGFAYFHDDGRVDYLLHPSDAATGIRYRLLPMIHAIINDLLTPEEARTHVGYIRRHLLGPDGARLFDRPPEYRGGRQRFFQRAESSSFFGREVGLMYTHAHLRYAEAMAHYGDADAFFLALRQANPIGIHDLVPCAARRQANCYYSSSDAAFADRYAAQSHYDDVRRGHVVFEGGWRVYSSGAGIALRLVHQCFLGLRKGRSLVTIDPVMPRDLDGLAVDLELDGAPVRVVYRIDAVGCGPVAVTLNGTDLPFERESNPYRPGGVSVQMAAVRERLRPRDNELTIRLG